MSEETRQISKLGRLARNLYDGLRRLPTVPGAYLHPLAKGINTQTGRVKEQPQR